MPNTTEEIMKDAGDIPASGFFDPVSHELVAAQVINVTRDATTGKLYGVLNVENSEQSGYVALSSPPSATNAGTETILTFSQQVNNITLYNGTSANFNYSFDETVTAGSLALAPGYQLDKTKRVTAVHILTAAAQNINGSSAGNIVVKGSL